MSHTDRIADFLTRIRNAGRAGLPTATMTHTATLERLARLFLEEGYIAGVEVVGNHPRKEIVVAVKFVAGHKAAITRLERVSKPGRRVYVGYEAIRPLRSGMGVVFLSTPRGIVTDAMAQRLKVGGEVLCRVW